MKKTMKNELFKKHYLRLCLEAGLRSALWGLALGFAVTFVLSALEWLFAFGAFWLSIVVFFGVSAIAGALLYVFKYRPTDVDVAHRLDRLGLDERMITMLEYKDDDSYIATLQRENAKVHFESVRSKKLKLRISSVLIAIAICTTILGSAMMTVLALSENGVIPSGSDIISGDDLVDYIPVSYIVEEGGYITGEADQLVAPGEDADPVVAEAEDGWMFVGWDDESTNPARHDKNITEPREYVAIFEPIEDDEDEDEGSGGMESEDDEGDQSSDQPGEDDETAESDGTQQEEQNQESQDGQPSDDESENEESESTDDSEANSGNNGQGSGGKWEETNMFYDGQTYYKDAMDYYENYYGEDSDIPPELREFFELYFGSL